MDRFGIQQTGTSRCTAMHADLRDHRNPVNEMLEVDIRPYGSAVLEVEAGRPLACTGVQES